MLGGGRHRLPAADVRHCAPSIVDAPLVDFTFWLGCDYLNKSPTNEET